jgi:hypothetical protein
VFCVFDILAGDSYLDMDEEDMAESTKDESGWKMVHGDVFRPPGGDGSSGSGSDMVTASYSPLLLAAMVGTGTQILTILVCVLIGALAGGFTPGHRDGYGLATSGWCTCPTLPCQLLFIVLGMRMCIPLSSLSINPLLLLSILLSWARGRWSASIVFRLYTAAILLYAITAGVSGFVSARLYALWGGDKWATNAVLTASLFAAPFFVTFAIINTMAAGHGSSTAIPFTTVLLIIMLWGLVTFPLTVFGALQGRKHAPKYDVPCKPNRVAREIPPIPLYVFLSYGCSRISFCFCLSVRAHMLWLCFVLSCILHVEPGCFFPFFLVYSKGCVHVHTCTFVLVVTWVGFCSIPSLLAFFDLLIACAFSYKSAPVLVILAGFLPFSAIYIELHYIFAAVWGHHVYTVFGILSLAVVMLLVVTSFVTIAMTYFQLSAEDHRWWWRSFLMGGYGMACCGVVLDLIAHIHVFAFYPLCHVELREEERVSRRT